jgi:ribosomal protein S18 acetylase RimI-like enzyme
MPTLPFPRLRSATEQDCTRIGAAHVQAWRETYAGLVPTTILDRLDARRRAEAWRRHLADDDELTCLTLAEDEAGAVLGFAAAGAPAEGALGWDAEVHALYVLGRAQRRGLGRRLLGHAVAHLHAGGALSVGLWVLRENQAARAFYASRGGRPVGERVLTLDGRALVEVAYLWTGQTGRM